MPKEVKKGDIVQNPDGKRFRVDSDGKVPDTFAIESRAKIQAVKGGAVTRALTGGVRAKGAIGEAIVKQLSKAKSPQPFFTGLPNKEEAPRDPERKGGFPFLADPNISPGIIPKGTKLPRARPARLPPMGKTDRFTSEEYV